MLSKSSNWELGFVHYIKKFTISRFIISSFLSVIMSYFLLLQNQNKPFHQSKTNHFQNRCMNLPEISNFHFLKTMNRSILGNNSQNNFHCKNNHFHYESKIIFLLIMNHFHMKQFFLNNNIFHHQHSNNNNNSIHINRYVNSS